MSGDNYKYDVFIGYSSKEYKLVEDLAKSLKTAGLSVWFDPHGRLPEIDTGTVLTHAGTLIIAQTRTLILLFSNDSWEKQWDLFEEQTLRFRDQRLLA